MAIGGIGGLGGLGSAYGSPSSPAGSPLGKSPEKTFLDYMKKSPLERFADSWLAAHHISREELAAMPPEKREAILKQMAEDMKQQLQPPGREADKSAINILA